MRGALKLVLSAVLAACPHHGLRAQDLAPRAYVITPIHSNAVTLTYSFSAGDVFFNNALPVRDATGIIHVPLFTYFHSLNFFGRTANFTAALPYGVGHFQGTVMDNVAKPYRSGLLDSSFRFSVNLIGGPSMSVKEFQSWQQKTILGVSLRVVAPTGQYDPTKLLNNGANRWGFKPELGYSRRWGHWVLDGYAGGWFFTTNPEYFSHNAYFPDTQTLSQSPIGSLEGHLSHDFKPRLWVSLDGNFWYGGSTSRSGIENPQTLQSNSRIGVTASVPLSKHQSVKVSYSNGAYVTFGGNFRNVSVAWQYSWLGRPN
jgi:hypothetical protein